MRCLPRVGLSLIIVGLLAACAKQQTQPTPQYTSAPSLTEHHLYPGDGSVHGVRQWLPKGTPSHVVLALHGYNDYSKAFSRMGEQLAAQGIAVIAYDQAGFGSTAQRGIWAGEQALRQDLAQAVAAVRAEYPTAPLVLLGESMGGAVVLSALAHGGVPANALQAVVLVSPAVWGGNNFNPVYRAPLWLLANMSPDAVLTGRGLRILPSDNLPMLTAMAKDPQVIHASRADAVLGLVRLMDSARAAAAKLPPQLPVLVMYGGNDMVVPPEAIESAIADCAAARKAPCDVRFYEEGYHMLLRDLEGRGRVADLAQWIAQVKQ